MADGITLPDAWSAFRTDANEKDDTRHEQCWDVVGEPLDSPIKKVVPEYYERLELGDKNIAMSKRGEILDLHWGRIEQDGSALVGLGSALQNLADTIKANVEYLATQWSGDSFEAFKTAMGKITTTLDAYSAGATKVGSVVLEAMTQARAMYADYATATAETLSFRHMSAPHEWHKMNEETGSHLRLVCPSLPMFCKKDDGEATAKLKDQFVSSRRLAICESDPCGNNLERVLIMYDNMVKAGKEGREKIRKVVTDWCDSTDDFKDKVESVLKVAVDNVHKLSMSATFSDLKVIGGGGQPTDTGSYPDDGSGGDSGPPPVGGPSQPIVEPTPEPEVTPEAVVEPPQETDQPAEAPADAEAPSDPTTVTIADGDRTIGVSDAGGGHVTVTVTDASGATKTYDLDFDAASGLQPAADAEAAADGVQQVPASTNGKCVIQNGDVTITAERPLFAPDQVTLTVTDGTGAPTTYTVDFPDVPDTDQPVPDAPTDAHPAGTPAPTGVAASDQAATNGAPAPTAAGGAASLTAGQPQPAGQLGAQSVPDATAAAGGAAQAASPNPAGQPGAQLAPEAPTGASPAGMAPANSAGQLQSAGQLGAQSVPDASVAAGAAQAAPPNSAGQPLSGGQLTAPQALAHPEDARGSVSGNLMPDPSDGEAGLAVAPDAPQPEHDAAGMIGSGLPMVAAPAVNSPEGGRGGSGWSVHGDLFDTGEPVYSMHGVLGDDDLDRRTGRS